jgi:4-amino-4-deoxy-L-arabinose transferase-like glycosyltransferase
MSIRQIARPGSDREVSSASKAAVPPLRRAVGLGATALSTGTIAVIVISAFLGFWHLDRYPRTWFDEGSYLEVARNIAERGDYVSESADGTRDFAPTIAVGPTVLLPAAASQAMFGPSLTAGRAVGACYLVLATAAVYLVASKLFGRQAALVGVAVLLAMPALDWLGTGRQLLGEAPAIFFLIAGAGIAFRGQCLKHAAVAGAVLGLAMVTKGQYLLVLPPSIVVVALFDRRDARLRRPRWYAVLLAVAFAVYLAWLGALLTLIGDGGIAENYRLLRQSSGGALLVFDIDRMRAAATLLLGPRSLFLVLPAAIFGLIAMLRTREPGRRLVIFSLWAFQALWLGWFATASIAWPRYAFAGLAVNAIFAGAMLSMLSIEIRAPQRSETAWQVGTAAIALAALLLLLAGGYREIRPVVTADEREPQHFATSMDSMVPEGAVVDGWEPEISFLSDRQMQYPPLGSLDRVVRATWLDGEEDVDLSDSLGADYLVIGHFGRWVGVYETALESSSYRLLVNTENYQLYERLDDR